MTGSFEEDMDYNYRHRNDPPKQPAQEKVWLDLAESRQLLKLLRSRRDSLDEDIAYVVGQIEEHLRLAKDNGWNIT